MNPLNHPRAHQISEDDVEKQGELKNAEVNVTTNSSSIDYSDVHDIPPTPVLKGKLARWNAKVEGLAGLEARGITRVLPEEKHDGGIRGYLQMVRAFPNYQCPSSLFLTSHVAIDMLHYLTIRRRITDFSICARFSYGSVSIW